MLRCLLPQVTQVWAKKQSAPDYTDQRFSRPFPLVGSFFTPIRAADMSLFRHYMTLKLRSGQGKTHTDQTKSENKVQSKNTPTSMTRPLGPVSLFLRV